MKDYLVSYGHRHFSGHRVVKANSEAEARAILVAEGYCVIAVVLATEDE